MKKCKTLALIISSTLILGNVASAQSIVDWSGGYVGGTVGTETGNSNAPWGYAADNLTSGNDPIELTGISFGGLAGYNFQNGNLVYGGELEYSLTTLYGDDGQLGGHTNGLDGGSEMSVRGRFGWATGSTLLYATAGYANWSTSGFALETPETVNYSLSGWTVGAGIEQSFNANWSGRLEYRQTTYEMGVAEYPDSGNYFIGFDPKVTTISAAILYHF